MTLRPLPGAPPGSESLSFPTDRPKPMATEHKLKTVVQIKGKAGPEPAGHRPRPEPASGPDVTAARKKAAGATMVPEYKPPPPYVRPPLPLLPELEEWERSNAYAISYREMREYVRLVMIGQIRLLLLYGPYGMAKTVGVSEELGYEHLHALEEWKRQPTDRRTFYEEDDMNDEPVARFRSPNVAVTSTMTPPRLFRHLWETSQRRETLFWDDPKGLEVPETQGYIQAAFDSTGLVTWSKKTPPEGGLTKKEKQAIRNGEPPPLNPPTPERFTHRGGLIMAINFRKHSAQGIAQRNILGVGVLSRAFEHELSWSDPALFQFIDKKGFVNDPKRGFWKFMIAQGFIFEPQVARTVLREVREYFYDRRDRLREMSFRTVETFIAIRLNFPADWRERLDRKLLPRGARRS